MSAEARLKPEHVRALRLGRGANCSSVGSVVDILFVSAAVGGAVFAAVCAAIEDEAAEVGRRRPRSRRPRRMIVRSEPWGAWVRVDEALVALDHAGVRALGLAVERACRRARGRRSRCTSP